MNLVISKSKLYDIIQKALPIIPIKSSLQILSNFKIKFSKNDISISASDLDQSIICSSECETDIKTEITINAKKLYEIVRELPEGNIYLSVDVNVLNIENKKGFSCKIAGISSQEFPDFPEIKEGVSFSISPKVLKEMTIKSSFAVSKEDTKSGLNGIYWKFDQGKTGMVATDGHRLGCSFTKMNFKLEKNFSFICNPKSLNHIVNILKEDNDEEKIDVLVGEKYVIFTFSDIKLCSKLIEGPYPDYEKVIPKSSPKKAIIDKNLIFDAVKRVSVLTTQNSWLIKFIFKNNLLEIIVQNKDIGGEAREIVPIEYTGPEHIIGFNSKYLLEILNLISSNKIRFEMNTQLSPCLIFPEFEKDKEKTFDDLFLLMPLRIIE
jgi:DNA polymerase-3 subunit beta